MPVFKVYRLEHAIIRVPALVECETEEESKKRALEHPDAALYDDDEWLHVTKVELDPDIPVEYVTDNPEYEDDIEEFRCERARNQGSAAESAS